MDSQHIESGGTNGGTKGDQVEPYLAPYRTILDAHGPSFEATGWKNRDMQIVRFDVLLDMADTTGRVVIDAGSGQGALVDRMIELGVEYGRYVGLDAMPEMVEQSRARRPPEAEFHTIDFAREHDAFSRFSRDSGGPGVDIILFSGSLNTMEQADAAASLERAWSAAREAVVFNFLSDRAPAALLQQDPSPARRLDTMALIDWALKKSPLVQFRQEYLGGHDATIALFKPGA